MSDVSVQILLLMPINPNDYLLRISFAMIRQTTSIRGIASGMNFTRLPVAVPTI